MQFYPRTLLFLSSLLSGAMISVNPITPKNVVEVDCLPFNFTKLCTATLNLGAPSNYIPIPGGVLVNEPILSGKVVGRAFNGTIRGDFAYPPICNGTLQVPVIDLYGTSDDGMDFYIHETGIGLDAAQVTRIEVNVGGVAYQKLVNEYILASVNPNANRTMVTVEVYLAQNTIP